MADPAEAPRENLPPGFRGWELGLVDAVRRDATMRWSVIDQLAGGKAMFEPALFWAGVKAAGLSRGTVNNRLSIHKRFPVSRRRENLLPAIHDEFRSLDDALLAAALERAEEYRWTREQARMRMKAFKAGDAQALEPAWTPAPVKSKQTPDDDAAAGAEKAVEADEAVFGNTAAGSAMSAEDRRDVLEGLADQKFASGNDLFEKIAATVERQGDPRRFSRECDLRRLNPKRARALAAFFMEIAAAAEQAQSGVLNSNSVSGGMRVAPAPEGGEAEPHASSSETGFAALQDCPGGRERLGQASTSVDEAPRRDGEGALSGQSTHLADNISRTGEAFAPLPSSETDRAGAGDDAGLDIPTFLRRGHADCAAGGPLREGGEPSDA